jgi:hypothetical protein
VVEGPLPVQHGQRLRLVAIGSEAHQPGALPDQPGHGDGAERGPHLRIHPLEREIRASADVEPHVLNGDRGGPHLGGQDRLPGGIRVDRPCHQHADGEAEGDDDRESQEALGQEPLQQEQERRHAEERRPRGAAATR